MSPLAVCLSDFGVIACSPSWLPRQAKSVSAAALGNVGLDNQTLATTCPKRNIRCVLLEARHVSCGNFQTCHVCVSASSFFALLQTKLGDQPSGCVCFPGWVGWIKGTPKGTPFSGSPTEKTLSYLKRLLRDLTSAVGPADQRL